MQPKAVIYESSIQTRERIHFQDLLQRGGTDALHVLCGGHEAKYWLEPHVELAKNTGIPEHKLNEIKKILEKYADSFKEQYQQHIGKRIDD